MANARIVAADEVVYARAEDGFSRAAHEPRPWMLHDLPAPATDSGSTAPAPTHEDYISTAARAAEEAYARGHADGVALGHDEARHEMTAPLSALAAAIAQLNEEQARLALVAEERIVSLALAVARHLVEREVQADPMILRRLIERGLGEFPAAQLVTVRMNPADLERLQAVPQASIATSNELAWVGDGRIGSGGCVLEGADRIVDSRVETAIERIYRHLLREAA